ncbi:MAG TPA: helix-turn-helix transcriptional regulator [Thermoanaerobaculia bacterium]|nr:helix-turn-helix transcriptional regulator [Thermoanaerobaculia bacterium]
MPRQASPDHGLVLWFLRSAQGWKQAELAEAAGFSPRLVNDYEHGRKPLYRDRLETLVAVLGLPPEIVDATLALLADARAASRTPHGPADPSGKVRRRIDALAAEAGRAVSDGFRSLLTLLTHESQAQQARQQAEALWARLAPRPAEERRALVDHPKAGFRSWALCERVAAESIAAAPNHPRKARELAELALRIAEVAPGPGPWRDRLQGYAWAFVGNARRACSDLPGAEKAMTRARKLWEAGAPGDPGFLEKAWLSWMEAALRRDQRRFPEALVRIDEALALDRGELRAQILITKSGILEALGNAEGSTAVLEEAAPLIDGRRDPRLALVVRFNLLVDLCRLGRAAEAEPGLPAVRRLAERLGEELDLLRVVWLEANVLAGLGRTAEAEAAFQQVRKAFAARGLAYDCALASLELALLLLEQGRAPEVRALAQEMLWIFQAQGVHRETLAALRLFYDVARKEEATIGLTRRVIAYLYRSQHDPELPFEDGAEAPGAPAQ